MLSGNLLTSLPEELSRCKELELLRIAANNLPALPDWLLNMPKLSWLAYAGNPIEEEHDCNDDVNGAEHTGPAVVPWSQLQVLERIGEGASGFVHKAVWRNSSSSTDAQVALDVAVKLFKGETTSDGLPLHEMQVLATWLPYHC